MVWEKGKSGNPHGTSKKQRQVRKHFIDDLYKIYTEEVGDESDASKKTQRGPQLIRKVAKEDPGKFFDAMVKLALAGKNFFEMDDDSQTTIQVITFAELAKQQKQLEPIEGEGVEITRFNETEH